MGIRQKLNEPIIFLTTFTSYTATHVIGEGGSGRIFEAQADSGDTWAIKWLVPNKVSREKVKRFKNELLFCSNNRHQNILTVVDHGIRVTDEAKSPFYVMPLYAGSLRTLLESNVAPDKTLVYFAQMLDGVEAAHLQGVVHRDLKPENILFDSTQDRLAIADFGIAQFQEDELYTAVETKDTQRLANFQYAAPEQRLRGSIVDQRADVFALGLMLNEMFTGKVPYGSGYQTIQQAVPEYEYLDTLVEAMIRQSPEERIGSVDEVKRQLIGRKNEFVTRQRISELKATVVPVADIDDLLIADPPRLVDADWRQGVLTLELQPAVNEKWIQALYNMGSYRSLLGKDPQAFTFRGSRATISASENQVQLIIDYFKEWLRLANRVYEERVRQERQKAEAAKRREIQKQIEEEEARQRVLKNLKI